MSKELVPIPRSRLEDIEGAAKVIRKALTAESRALNMFIDLGPVWSSDIARAVLAWVKGSKDGDE